MQDDRPKQDRSSTDVTQLLDELRKGDESALDRLLPIVYDELRRIAHGQRRRNVRPGETLDTTALVHEAYFKLANAASKLENREHFYAVAATAMRQLLVDRARRHLSQKRGGDVPKLSLDDHERPLEHLLAGEGDQITEEAVFVIDLDRALRDLARENERYLKIVECRFFAGMTATETAEVLGLSERTVRRDWLKARVWLELYFQSGQSSGEDTQG